MVAAVRKGGNRADLVILEGAPVRLCFPYLAHMCGQKLNVLSLPDHLLAFLHSHTLEGGRRTCCPLCRLARKALMRKQKKACDRRIWISKEREKMQYQVIYLY
jgi:hypothetical protein